MYIYICTCAYYTHYICDYIVFDMYIFEYQDKFRMQMVKGAIIKE